MSKRTRAESEVHADDEDTNHKFAELEAKFAESERHLLYLRTLKLQKLREQPGGIATELLVQSYTDPLVHLELHSIYRKYNDMVIQLHEKEKELAILASFPDASTLLKENKRLKTIIDEKDAAHNMLQIDFQDSMKFINELQSEILSAKKDISHLQKENEKLQTEVFSWQQQAQFSAQKTQEQNETEPDMMPGTEEDHIGSHGNESPVLHVEEVEEDN